MQANRKYVLMPIGIPALGKSHLIKSFQAHSPIPSVIISSDDLRLSVMKGLIAANSMMSKEEAFEKSRKKAITHYHEALEQNLKSSKESELLIMLDKNHIPSTLGKAVQDVKLIDPNAIVILLVPREESKLKTGEGLYYFSVKTIVHCLYRLTHRDKHETLDNENKPKSVGVFLSFLKQYRNFTVDKKYLTDVHGVLEVSMSNQAYDLNIDTASALIEASLQDIKNFDVLKYENINKLTEYIEKLSLIPEIDNKDAVAYCIAELNKIKSSYKGIEPAPKKVKEESKVAPSFTKIPIFLGLELQKTKEEILKFIEAALTQSKAQWKEESKDYLTKLNETIIDRNIGGKSKWKYPNTYHITTIFIGKSLSLEITSQEAYKQFKEGEAVKAYITAIIVAFGKIMFGIVNVKYPVSNKIPHITLLTGQYPPKMSNTVASLLFLEKGPASDVYNKILKENYEDGYGEYTVFQGADKLQCAVVTFKSPIEIQTVAKAF